MSRTYFEKRIYDELGFTEKEIQLKLTVDFGDKIQTIKIPQFNEDEHGNIEIPVYTIEGQLIKYKNPKSDPDHPNINNNRDLTFKIKRLKTPKKYKDKVTGEESEAKYELPKGAGTFPYFPPLLLEAYKKATPINTLVLTEGYFKSSKACKHQIPCVGLSSITHVKEKDTEAMYEDVIKLINRCQVENVIVLYDGDCRNISLKALESGRDLQNRPSIFVSSVIKVRELLKDYNIEVYFGHVDSDNIEHNPKGLDDLLVSLKDRESEVTADLLSFSRRKQFFYTLNISAKDKLTKLWDYFHLTNVDRFYLEHEKYLKGRKFKFKGTVYEYNEEKNRCIVERPKDIDNYFRVGDTYYEFVKVPNKYEMLETQMHPRSKDTIKDDFGKSVFADIPKYKAFCNVPNHENYSRIIHECFNIYNEFEHQPEEGECPVSLEFMEHIFEEHIEIGLDYIQLLYQNPTQILPILCLVSRANNTGKSTFIKWLKDIFSQNMAIVGNNDFANDFNSHWVGKILIACEESFIDKPAIMQKIKSLSTANKTSMNRKGKDQGEVDFYGKFILASNEVEHFIYAGKDDIRYWVREIKTPKKDNPNMLKLLYDEIPAFLHYLSKRKMSVQSPLSRMWFTPSQIRTAAFQRVIDANRPRNEREIRVFLRHIFLEFGATDTYKEKPCIILTLNMIHEKIFNKRITLNELSKILSDHIKPDLYTDKDGKRITKRCALPYYEATESQDPTNMPFSYYKGVGKPFVFYADEYLTADELKELDPKGTDLLTDKLNNTLPVTDSEEIAPF